MRGFWRDLNTPDNFARDPYGELTNQLGHTMLGMLLTTLFLCAWRETQGEMPVRSWTFLAVFLPYVIGVEWVRQKWVAGDSWFDSIMVALGSAAALLPFKEVEITGHRTAISFDHRTMLALMAVWSLFLFLRVLKRTRG